MNDHLLVGLGNPGNEYSWTRHNIGFLAVSYLADLYQIKWVKSSKYQGMIGAGMIDGKRVHFLLPLTYMNLSGLAVKAFVKGKGIALENILVVCDDLHLELGALRLRSQGSAGGHNGLASVIAQLQTPVVARLRLGIGAPQDKDQTKDFVLSSFKASEKKRLQEMFVQAADCCRVFLASGISQAMTRFNQRSKQEEEKDEKI